MKKLISIMLALVFVFSMATVALAETVTYAPSTATTFSITKTYTSTESFVPGETLNFTIEKDSENPADTMIKIGTNDTFAVTGLSNTITVKVPSYSVAGIYKYTIKEQAGNTAGVTSYDTSKVINVSVLVEYDNENNKLVLGNTSVDGVQYFITRIDGTKTDTFQNEFKTNDFTVAKDVTGNMSNVNDTFTASVTLTSDKDVLTPIKVAGTTVEASAWNKNDESGKFEYTTTITLSEADGAKTFAYIPYGVSVSVVETGLADGVTANGYTLKGYKIGDSEELSDSVSFTVDKTAKSVTIVNEKTTSVDTGISLDSVPFILILAVCAGAAILFVTKRRSVEF